MAISMRLYLSVPFRLQVIMAGSDNIDFDETVSDHYNIAHDDGWISGLTRMTHTARQEVFTKLAIGL